MRSPEGDFYLRCARAPMFIICSLRFPPPSSTASSSHFDARRSSSPVMAAFREMLMVRAVADGSGQSLELMVWEIPVRQEVRFMESLITGGQPCPSPHLARS
jgi:hypothetical protein